MIGFRITPSVVPASLAPAPPGSGWATGTPRAPHLNVGRSHVTVVTYNSPAVRVLCRSPCLGVDHPLGELPGVSMTALLLPTITR